MEYMVIVLSFAPSAAAVGHCDFVRPTCESKSVRRSAFSKRWAWQFVFEKRLVETLETKLFRHLHFCNDLLSLSGVNFTTFGVPGARFRWLLHIGGYHVQTSLFEKLFDQFLIDFRGQLGPFLASKNRPPAHFLSPWRHFERQNIPFGFFVGGFFF